MQAPPLPEGFLLEDRFQLGPVLGRGGFGVTYLAHDLDRREPCVVKELLPAGVSRDESGRVALSALGPSAAQRLRHQFTQEARVLQRISARGLLPVRAAFPANGTAYYVTPYLAGAVSLDRLLMRDGPMDATAALDIAMQVLETLEALHQAGVLHRDLKPSNVLVTPSGEAYLIDLGSARAWHTDRQVQHTVQYTPGFAPIEQMSERARRGPATDLYGLAATLYTLLVGGPPPAAPERVSGQPLVPIRDLRPDVESSVARAIECALAIRYEERPQSVAEFRELIAMPEEDQAPILERLARLDAAFGRLARFRVARRECPECGGVLETPRPLRRLGCPVCRAGRIVARRLDMRLCPSCRSGVLHQVRNDGPLAFCPACGTGRLRGGLRIGKRRFACAGCPARFEAKGGEVRRVDQPSEPATWTEWRTLARRGIKVHVCDLCHAQYDEENDGSWRQVTPAPSSRSRSVLMPEEWAMVAAGMDPAQGNAECDACGADFFLEPGHATLLASSSDPFGFAAEHAGRRFGLEDMAYVAVGKTSGEVGMVCPACRIEFDGDGEDLTLVATRHPALRSHVGESHSLVDWRRIAERLPLFGHEAELDEAMVELLREAYRQGEVPLDSRRPGVLWKGQVMTLERDEVGAWAESGRTTMIVESGEVSLGGLLRRSRRSLGELAGLDAQGERIVLEWDDGEWGLDLDPVVLEAKLEHARSQVELTAEDLAARLHFERAAMAQGRAR
jgi:Zn-finger nucleic acid-binding protein/predicted Ser/Thr protein kinase